MKMSIRVPAAVLALVVGAGTVGFAQSTATLSCSVPFEFVVGEKTLPAGRYEISRRSSAGQMLVIRNKATGQEVSFVGIRAERSVGTAAPTLTFRRYGDKSYLAGIWDAGSRLGTEVAQGPSERLLASVMPTKQVGLDTAR